MDGTGTYGVQFRDVFVPDEMILAEPAGPFVKKIRAGFILLQAGMALGLIKDCIQIMDEVDAPLGHVNRYLPQQPTQFRELHAEFEKETMALARDPYNADDSYWRRVGGATTARRRRQRGGRACRDAPLRRPRLPEEPSRAAPASRGLFRRHRHPRHKTASQDAGRRRALEEFSVSTHPATTKQERPAMTDVLITAGELAEFLTKEPCVVIDTRNPEAYGAGHLPGAVNIHEIFTYLATSTPEGMAELKTKFANAFGAAGLSGKETAVIYEQSMNPVSASPAAATIC